MSRNTKSFDDFDSLLKYVDEEVTDSMQKDVANEIKRKISEKARQNVILETSGRPSGGIDDVKEMESKLDKKTKVMTLTVKDTAKPSPSVFGTKFNRAKDAAVGGTMFANWIEHGEWVDLRALLAHRSGKWSWSPLDGPWADLYDPVRASREPGSLTKKERDYKPRRESRPFIAPVQDEINMNPEEIISILRKRFE